MSWVVNSVKKSDSPIVDVPVPVPADLAAAACCCASAVVKMLEGNGTVLGADGVAKPPDDEMELMDMGRVS